jgi:spore germination protein GerM
MSDVDQRIRDLMSRVANMAPAPPPFPTEATLRPRPERRTPPALVFVGAALAVVAVALIPVLLFGGGPAGVPVGGTPQTTVPAVTEPGGVVPSTTVPPTTTTPSAGIERGAIVFLAQTPENSFTGNPSLVPFFTRVVADPDTPEVLVALQVLTHESLTPPPGFDNLVPRGVEVLGVTDRDDGVRVVDMNEAFARGSGSGLLGDITMLNQLVFTSTDGEVVTEVLFTIEGGPVTAFGAEGLVLDTPVGRDDFLDHLNPIVLESAVVATGDGPMVITGIANVYEATVNLEVVDPGGTVVYEDTTTASCGSGCWGRFSFHIDAELDPTGNTLRVFWLSPEDGEPSDVVSIPIAWSDWATHQLLP